MATDHSLSLSLSLPLSAYHPQLVANGSSHLTLDHFAELPGLSKGYGILCPLPRAGSQALAKRSAARRLLLRMLLQTWLDDISTTPGVGGVLRMTGSRSHERRLQLELKLPLASWMPAGQMLLNDHERLPASGLTRKFAGLRTRRMALDASFGYYLVP